MICSSYIDTLTDVGKNMETLRNEGFLPNIFNAASRTNSQLVVRLPGAKVASAIHSSSPFHSIPYIQQTTCLLTFALRDHLACLIG